MGVQLFSNNADTTLAVGIDNTTETITLATGTGSLFPTPSGEDWFLITIVGGGNVEVCRCRSRSGDTLTVTRAWEAIGAAPAATAYAFPAGSVVQMRFTSGTFGDNREFLPFSRTNTAVGYAVDQGGVLQLGINAIANDMIARNGITRYTTSAVAGNVQSLRNTAASFYFPSAGVGRIVFTSHFAPCYDTSPVSGRRFFVGISTRFTAPANQNGDAYPNTVGVELRDDSNNLAFCHSDASTSGYDDLGSDFPGSDTNRNVRYRLTIVAITGSVELTLEKLSPTYAITKRTYTTSIPVADSGMGILLYVTNNATAAATSAALMSIETRRYW